jgi:hypothetical protein
LPKAIASVGVESVKLPPRSPNLNAYADRFVRRIKESCLDRMIFFGEGSLRKGIDEFVLHYHAERNHQGLDNRLIVPDKGQAGHRGAVLRRERLGGLLNCYYRAAALNRGVGRDAIAADIPTRVQPEFRRTVFSHRIRTEDNAVFLCRFL